MKPARINKVKLKGSHDKNSKKVSFFNLLRGDLGHVPRVVART
jgi:hypothetical protein